MSVQTMERMVDWVEQNLENAPTLEKMSGFVGYSPCYCSEKFREHTGLTFQAYLSRRQLVRVTKECVEEGLKRVKPGNFLGDVGAAVHAHARKYGYSVVAEIGGHGVGLEFHEEPFVSFVSPPGRGPLLRPGMVFTIEPMVNAGSPEVTVSRQNGWTVRTRDGRDSAQWEVTVLVTETGHEVLAR